MQKYNQIKSLLFLGIFSLLLLHQLVPHLHHQHEVEHMHKAFEHSDNHSHSHDDVPEKESSNKGLFGLFMEIHVHSVLSNEFILTQDNSAKELNGKKDIKRLIIVSHFCISENYDDENEKLTAYHPPNIYLNPYLTYLVSRGPPLLG
jgi:hypothetical protein